MWVDQSTKINGGWAVSFVAVVEGSANGLVFDFFSPGVLAIASDWSDAAAAAASVGSSPSRSARSSAASSASASSARRCFDLRALSCAFDGGQMIAPSAVRTGGCVRRRNADSLFHSRPSGPSDMSRSQSATRFIGCGSCDTFKRERERTTMNAVCRLKHIHKQLPDISSPRCQSSRGWWRRPNCRPSARVSGPLWGTSCASTATPRDRVLNAKS